MVPQNQVENRTAKMVLVCHIQTVGARKRQQAQRDESGARTCAPEVVTSKRDEWKQHCCCVEKLWRSSIAPTSFHQKERTAGNYLSWVLAWIGGLFIDSHHHVFSNSTRKSWGLWDGKASYCGCPCFFAYKQAQMLRWNQVTMVRRQFFQTMV